MKPRLTVEELINKLKEMPQNAEVHCIAEGNFYVRDVLTAEEMEMNDDAVFLDLGLIGW